MVYLACACSVAGMYSRFYQLLTIQHCNAYTTRAWVFASMQQCVYTLAQWTQCCFIQDVWMHAHHVCITYWYARLQVLAMTVMETQMTSNPSSPAQAGMEAQRVKLNALMRQHASAVNAGHSASASVSQSASQSASMSIGGSKPQEVGQAGLQEDQRSASVEGKQAGVGMPGLQWNSLRKEGAEREGGHTVVLLDLEKEVGQLGT